MRIKTGLMVAAFVMLAGCSAPAQHAAVETCKAENQMKQTTLYFGLNRPAGAQITGNEWQQFVDQDVTPRFRPPLLYRRPEQAKRRRAQNLQHQPRKARRQQAYQRCPVYKA